MSERNRPRHRFAVAPESVHRDEVRFSPVAARQMRRVLRLKPGDRVTAFDGSGTEYSVLLVSLRDEGALGAIDARAPIYTEPALEITLCQALLPREKFELVLQKGTEIGVAAFVPLVTERTIVPASTFDAARQERCRRIIQEAAEQSGRARLPALSEPVGLSEAIGRENKRPALLAWECETSLSVRQALVGLERRLREAGVMLFVGPEGGFSSAEALAARSAGAVNVSLGPRILRAETAGLVMAALALYQSGDLEPPR